jgi:hypothetical protein
MVDTGFLFPTFVGADSTGNASFATTGGGGSITNRLSSDDGNVVTAPLKSGWVSNILTMNFDLSSIPDSATINGIEVSLETQGTNGSGSVGTFTRFKAGPATAKDTATKGRTDSWSVETVGGPTDVWGLPSGSLTGSGFKSAFGLTLQAIATVSGTGTSAYDIDYVRLKVYYTDVDNTAPTISTSSTATVAEGATLAVALTANETVTWSLISSSDSGNFEISGTTLRWKLNGTKDYESPSDSDHNNSYVAIVRATDTAGNSTDKTITVTVTNDPADDLIPGIKVFVAGQWVTKPVKVYLNGAWVAKPLKRWDSAKGWVIVGSAPPPPADTTAPTITTAATRNVQENSTLSIALTADEAVNWAIVGGTDSAQFEISGTTLRWKTNKTQDYEAPVDGGANNTYIVIVRATDGAGNSTDKTITVTVTDSTADNPDSTAPTITSSATKSVVENATLSHSLTANESVTWSIVGGVDQGDFKISGSTLQWINNGTKDYENSTDSDGNNTYVVIVRATDSSGNWTNQTITVTVTNSTADDVDTTPPSITSSATKSVVENSTLAHSLTANETVTWSISGGADSAQFEISGSTLRWKSNGTKDYEAPADSGSNNVYNVTVRATDAAGNFTDQAVAVTVTNSTADDGGGGGGATYNPAAGNYPNNYSSFQITASAPVVWNWSVSGIGVTSDVATGGTASSISFNIASTRFDRTATVTVNSGGKTWTITMFAIGTG